MTDPSDGLRSFQQELRRGGIAIQVAKTDSNLFVHRDAPNGPPEYRFTYVRLKGKTVTAMVIFAAQPPESGKPYFAVGYAVPKRFQGQGRAKDVLVAAIADMQAGLVRNGIPEFYIEAIVGADNAASRRIAELPAQHNRNQTAHLGNRPGEEGLNGCETCIERRTPGLSVGCQWKQEKGEQ